MDGPCDLSHGNTRSQQLLFSYETTVLPCGDLPELASCGGWRDVFLAERLLRVGTSVARICAARVVDLCTLVSFDFTSDGVWQSR